MDFPNPILAFPSIIPKTMQAWPGLLENTSTSSGEHTLHIVSAIPKYLKPEIVPSAPNQSILHSSTLVREGESVSSLACPSRFAVNDWLTHLFHKFLQLPHLRAQD